MSPVTSELFFLVLLLGLLATALAGNATGVENGCQNGEWDPSVVAWENENMSGSLEAWWRETTGNGTKEKNFSHEIGKIGDAVLSLACGINTHDQCVNPSCDGEFFPLHIRKKSVSLINTPCYLGLADFLRASKNIKWAYFVRVSMVNLSRFLKAAHVSDQKVIFSLREGKD